MNVVSNFFMNSEKSYSINNNSHNEGNVKWWETFWQLLKNLNIHLPYDPAFQCYLFTQEKGKHLSLHKNLYRNVSSSFLCNSQNWKPLKCWMNKPFVISPNNRILFSNKNEWSVYTHSNIIKINSNKSAEWKKPDKKEFILCYSLYSKL